MLALGSVLTARLFFDAIAPTQCWMAPELPHATYSSGAIRVPVSPTGSGGWRQPLLVTAREQPTTPPSAVTSSSSGAKPSALPTPRPPPTTTLAVARVTPASRSTRFRTIVAADAGSIEGVYGRGSAAAGAVSVDASTAWSATVSSLTGAVTVARSRSDPPQRTRVR